MTIDQAIQLISQLNPYCKQALKAGIAFAKLRRHHEVYPEHLLIRIVEQGQSDLSCIIDYFNINQEQLWDDLLGKLNQYRAGNNEDPLISQAVLRWFSKAKEAQQHYNTAKITSLCLTDAILQQTESAQYNALSNITATNLQQHWASILVKSAEDTYQD